MSPSGPPETTFRAWSEDHRGIFVKVARSYARGEHEAAELQQEMLFQVWLSVPRFAGQAKPSTWIYRVCLNTALSWRRGTQRRENWIDRESDPAALAAEAATPAETAGDRELLEQLYAAIHGLAEFDRALVLLSLDGLAYREIAEVTGLTENHVGVALTRARQRLAARLKGVADELE